MIVQGRRIEPADLVQVRQLLAANPLWTRRRLSRELCELWNWRSMAGQLKDMSCRSLLLKLHRQGLIELPAPTRRPPQLNGPAAQLEEQFDQTAVHGKLPELRPVRLQRVDDTARRRLLQQLLRQHHYLGHGMHVGENIGYVAVDRNERVLGCLLFGAAAWKTRVRDQFIGWNAQQRERNLLYLTCNTRFLIVPWVEIKCLASHLLSLAVRRLNDDWQHKYGHGIELVETFVDRSRFRGTCYQAANWLRLGQTTGRTRQDQHRQISTPRKDVYVYVLSKRFREVLCQ